MIIKKQSTNMKKYLYLIKNYSLSFLITAFFGELKRKLWREKVWGSFAQDYEDIEIEKILTNKTGRYLEIGAYHPTRLSNTYRLYMKGWTGVVIEPNPDVKNLFYKSRPRDKFINFGISDNGIKLKYYKFLIPALNTFSKTEANKSIGKGHNLVRKEMILTIKITDIVKENFDLLSIDTEGFDAVILKTWPWAKFKPKVICVESDVKRLLIDKGYILATTTKNNFIYVKNIL